MADAPMVDVMAILVERGILLESARGPLPNVAELVAGERITGSWWGHRSGSTIFNVINELADSRDVVRLRLVNDRITLVHRRLWPAIFRLGDRFAAKRLTAISEEHTATGAHRKVETPFPNWVPADVELASRHLTDAEAFALLPECARPAR